MALASDSDGFLKGQPLDLGRTLDLWRAVRSDIAGIKEMLRKGMAAAEPDAPQERPAPAPQPARAQPPVVVQPLGKATEGGSGFARALEAVAAIAARAVPDSPGRQMPSAAPSEAPSRPLGAGSDAIGVLEAIEQGIESQETTLEKGLAALKKAIEDLTDATRWAKDDDGGLLSKLPGLLGKAAGVAKGAVGKAGGAAKSLLGKAGGLLKKLPIRGAGPLAAVLGAVGLAHDFEAADADETLTERGRTVKKGEAVGKFGGTMAGSAAGAMAGAALGPVGMLAGAVIGGALGAWGGAKAGGAVTDTVLAPEAPGTLPGPAPGRGVPGTASEAPPGAPPEPRSQADRRASRTSGGSGAPGPSDFVPPVTAPGGPVSAGDRHLLERIAHGEGTSDVKARKHGFDSGYDVSYGFGKYSPKTDKPLSQMTLGEVKQYQKDMLANQKGNKLRSTAVGKYQILNSTLNETQQKLGLSDDTIYSPEVQDQMGMELLKRRGYDKWKAAGPGEREDADRKFQKELAKEWASVADPDTGKSYHKQHVGTTSAEIRSAMDVAKTGEAPGQPPAPQTASTPNQPPAPQTAGVPTPEQAAQAQATLNARRAHGNIDVDNLDADMAVRVAAFTAEAEQEFGRKIQVQSAYRPPTAKEKAAVGSKGNTQAGLGKSHMVAGTYSSMHGRGEAVDLKFADMASIKDMNRMPQADKDRWYELSQKHGLSMPMLGGEKGPGTGRKGSKTIEWWHLEPAREKIANGGKRGDLGLRDQAHADFIKPRSLAAAAAGAPHPSAAPQPAVASSAPAAPNIVDTRQPAGGARLPPYTPTLVAMGQPASSAIPPAPGIPSAPSMPRMTSAPAVTEPVTSGRASDRKDDNTPVVGDVSQDVRDRRVAHIVTGGIGAAM